MVSEVYFKVGNYSLFSVFDEMPMDPDISESEAPATDGEPMHDNHFGTHYSWHTFFS